MTFDFLGRLRRAAPTAVIALLSIVLSAWAGEKIVDRSASERPAWITRAPEEREAVFAVGAKTGAPSFEAGRQGAVETALEDLARYLGVTIRARMESVKTVFARSLEDTVTAAAGGHVQSSRIQEVYFEERRAGASPAPTTAASSSVSPTREARVFDVWALLRYPIEEVREARAQIAEEARRLEAAVAAATEHGRRRAAAGDAPGAFQQYALAMTLSEGLGPRAGAAALSETLALFRRFTVAAEPVSGPAQAGAGLAAPLRVRVRCQARPVAGVPVRFRFTEGRGALDARALTDRDGIAETRVRGLFALSPVNRVEMEVHVQDLLPTPSATEAAGGPAAPPLRAGWTFASAGRVEDILDAPQVVRVEPFQAAVDDPAAAWLAGGIEGGLRDRLSQSKRVRIAENGLPAEGGADVDAVVTGTVQKMGAQVRVTARILDGARRAGLGAAAATGRVEEIFHLQEQVAGQVLAALGIGAEGPAAKPETTSLAAYRAFVEGNAALARGEAAEAESFFLRAVAEDPKYAKAWNNLGASRMHAGRAAEALVAFQKAAALDPVTPRHWVNVAVAAQSAGVAARAPLAPLVESSLGQALERDPDFPPALLVRGELLMREGHAAEAAPLFERAARAAPQSAEAQNALGVAWDRLGQPEKAAAAYRRAIAVDPKHARAHSNLGALHDRQGRHEEAVVCFRTALALNPQSAAAWTNLGLAYAHLGDGDSALKVARTAAELHPRSEPIRANLAAILQAVSPR